METQSKTKITIEADIQASVSKVWEIWNDPAQIVVWNVSSEGWHTPKASHELKPGGRFVFTLAAKDGSMSFDFSGTYDQVIPNELLTYTLDDERKVEVLFKNLGERTRVVQTFEAENTNPVELQRAGWQNILNSFKKYVESH